MEEIRVKIRFCRSDAVMPEYATNGSAAVDLHYAGEETLTIQPNERRLVPTGIAIAPETSGVVAMLCARSGLASKKGLTLSNGIGVIDSDYRGEISAAMINLGSEPVTIQPDDRIAQLMFVPVYHARLLPVDALEETERGSGGFGSTGVGKTADADTNKSAGLQK